jgi:hypothetical protein
MDFVPDGWLASFSEAVELYETTRFSERLTILSSFGMDRFSRQFALKKAEKEGRSFNEDEEAELSALNTEYRRIEQMTQKRMIEMSAQLRQKLFAGEIKASIQDQKTGRMVPIPGQFWASTNAEILTNRRIGYNSNTITGFGGYGPVRICREDVVKAAKPASDPPDEALVPKQGELKKDYILRALNMKEVRSISAKEGRELAPFWLKAKGFPCAPEDIAAESRRMTALMSGLARPQDGKPKRTKPQAVAKSPRSRSKVRAKSVRSNSE